jgi:hypothetical protein
MDNRATTDRTPAANSTYKKLAVQWLNEALCFVASLVVADSFRLRNRQLLVAAKRYLDTIQGLLKKIISGSGIPKRVILHSL